MPKKKTIYIYIYIQENWAKSFICILDTDTVNCSANNALLYVFPHLLKTKMQHENIRPITSVPYSLRYSITFTVNGQPAQNWICPQGAYICFRQDIIVFSLLHSSFKSINRILEEKSCMHHSEQQFFFFFWLATYA